MATVNASRHHAPCPAPRPPEPDPALLDDTDLTEGRDAIERTFTATVVRQTIILDGYGLALRVSKGELEACDGIGTQRRTRRISRADAAAGRVRRVLVLGEGMVTTEAVSWCAALGVAVIITGASGEVLAMGAPELFSHGALVRAQALAAYTDTGIEITRWLLGMRLADQAWIAGQIVGRQDRSLAIDELRLQQLPQASTPAEAMIVEMHAAEHYWSAWTDELRLTFAPRDRARVPTRWTRFGSRVSPLNEAASNRHAATPANALLNLGYRLAEIEATVACRALGLDPAMGLAHADRAHRPALVFDLIETVRGLVEETVWSLSVERRFRKADFGEGPTGEVRVLAPLSHEYAQALIPLLRGALSPVVERVAAELAEVAFGDVRVPTALTRARHKSSHPATDERGKRQTPNATAALWACPDCGGSVTDRQRVRCDVCVDADPGQTQQIRGRRGKAIAARRRSAQAWESAGGQGTYDPKAWPDILAGLADVKLSAIVAATGLSKSFACVVRAGKSTPHPSHWPALAALGATQNLPRAPGSSGGPTSIRPNGRRGSDASAHTCVAGVVPTTAS